jgi:hypothetical protein
MKPPLGNGATASGSILPRSRPMGCLRCEPQPGCASPDAGESIVSRRWLAVAERLVLADLLNGGRTRHLRAEALRSTWKDAPWPCP